MSEAQADLGSEGQGTEHSALGGEGGGGQQEIPSLDFRLLRQTLPTELRDNALLDQYEGEDGRGLTGLVQDYQNVQRLIGGEKIARPKDDSPQEDWDRFYNAMGRPDDPEGYDLSEFKPPEGLPWDENFQNQMLPRMHKAGLTNSQVQQVLQGYAELQGQAFEQRQMQLQEAAAQSVESLRGEWGAAFEAKIEKANRAFKAALGKDADAIGGLRLEDGTLLGDHPAIVKAFEFYGSRMSEDEFVGDKGASGAGVMTPDAAKAEIERIERTMSNIVLDPTHIEHDAVKKRLQSLFKMAYPEGQDSGFQI